MYTLYIHGTGTSHLKRLILVAVIIQYILPKIIFTSNFAKFRSSKTLNSVVETFWKLAQGSDIALCNITKRFDNWASSWQTKFRGIWVFKIRFGLTLLQPLESRCCLSHFHRSLSTASSTAGSSQQWDAYRHRASILWQLMANSSLRVALVQWTPGLKTEDTMSPVFGISHLVIIGPPPPASLWSTFNPTGRWK